MPTISILLPFYQAVTTLSTAIESIVQQGFTDWELLLIDNNSSDGSRLIAEQWAANDEKVRVLHEPVQGIAHALNTGIAYARGRYLARMDADDVCSPDRLYKQMDFLKRNPAIQVVSCQCRFESEVEQSEGFAHYVQWQNSILTPEQHYLSRFIESPLAHPTVLFEKQLIGLYGGYSTAPLPEDYELWLRWMSKGVRFAKVPEILYTWNDLPARLTRVHEHYSPMAFSKVKAQYLADWISKHVAREKQIVVCGTSKVCLERLALLEAEGIFVHGVTDVRTRHIAGRIYVPPAALASTDQYFVLNLISKRGVNDAIRSYLTGLGYEEGKGFLLAG